MSFDIVIPLGPNEVSRFNEQIEYTKKNVIGYRIITPAKGFPIIGKKIIEIINKDLPKKELINKKGNKYIPNPAYYVNRLKNLNELEKLCSTKERKYKRNVKLFNEILSAENNAIFLRNPDKQEIVDFLEHTYDITSSSRSSISDRQTDYIKIFSSTDPTYYSNKVYKAYTYRNKPENEDAPLLIFLKNKIKDALIQAKIKEYINVKINQELYLMNFLNLISVKRQKVTGRMIMHSLNFKVDNPDPLQ